MVRNIKIKSVISLLLFACFPFFCLSQEEDKSNNGFSFKSMRPKKKKDSITFTANDYKIISHLRDTTAVDTTLTIYKHYKNNVWQKDLFGKMPFSNAGQPYNTLTYSFLNSDYLPSMGAQAKKQLYLTPEEIKYYLLPTPLTDLTYKSAMEQGQHVNALFSVNLNPNWNVFIAYKGLRSLGNYQRILVSNGNLRFGFSYISPDKKYTLFAHYAGHDITSQENGGISRTEQFESGDKQFKNRALIDINLTDAENIRESKRYFLQHDYAFLPNKDTLSSYKQIRFRHRFLYETEYYKFTQNAKNDFFGDSYVLGGINDRMQLIKTINTIGAEVELPYLGKTFLYGNAYFYNYFFRNAVYFSGVLQPHQIKNTEYSLAVQWNKKLGGFSVDAQGEQTLIGNITGTNLHGKLSYTISADNQLVAGINIHSAMPNFNALLYQSDYKNYNWNNYGVFDKQYVQMLYTDVKTRWANASVSVSNIKNYTFFKAQNSINNKRGQSVASQHSDNIQYLKIQLQKEFRLGKFGLENTLLYQNVVQNEHILNVPSLITRNTLFFSSDLFDKAMFLQTGIGFNYFTSYYSDRYNPLLAEFEVQNIDKIGGYPIFDFFLNAKVRTMRIFFSIENFHPYIMDIKWLFNKQYYNYYSAPQQPYRDLKFRLGISWNLFS